MRIKAVIFDWGDVYLDWKGKFWDTIAERLNVEMEILEKEVQKHWNLLGKGTIDDKEFWNRVAEGLKIKIPDDSETWIEERFRDDFSVNKDIEAIAKDLQKFGYKTALLSNTEKTSLDYGRKKGWTKYFDVIIASCDFGVMKPDERIYKIAIERIGEKPEYCVFIENDIRYVKVAAKLGWKTILFDNVKQDANYLKRELIKLGINKEVFKDG